MMLLLMSLSTILSRNPVTPDNAEKHIGFVSRTLENADKRYTQVDKEELCIFINFGAKNSFTIYGVGVGTVFTDSKPVCLFFLLLKVLLYCLLLEYKDMHYIYKYFNMVFVKKSK